MFAHFYTAVDGKSWTPIGADVPSDDELSSPGTWTQTAEKIMRRWFLDTDPEVHHHGMVRCDLIDSDGELKASVRQVPDFM